MDVHEEEFVRTSDVVKRNGKLYNKLEHTYEFDDIAMNVVWLFPFEDLPRCSVDTSFRKHQSAQLLSWYLHPRTCPLASTTGSLWTSYLHGVRV